MASIQGISSTAVSYGTPKAAAPAAPKSELGESAQVERQEAVSGTKEVGEAPAANVGTKFSVTA